MDDLNRELAATGSVSASVKTLAHSLWNRLTTALEADSGRGDFGELRAIRDDLAPDRHDALVSSILKGTPAEEDDTDRTAPPLASNPGSAAGNVFGSKGPEETPLYRGPQPGIEAGERDAFVPQGRATPEEENASKDHQADAFEANKEAKTTDAERGDDEASERDARLSNEKAAREKQAEAEKDGRGAE